MCDAIDHVVGVVLGKENKKKVHVIHYVSKVLNEAQIKYSTIENSF